MDKGLPSYDLPNVSYCILWLNHLEDTDPVASVAKFLVGDKEQEKKERLMIRR